MSETGERVGKGEIIEQLWIFDQNLFNRDLSIVYHNSSES